MPSLGEYLGGSLQRASARVLPYWMDKQQLARQGEQDAYQKERDQIGDTRIADALAQQKAEFEYTRNRNRQQDFLGMIQQIEEQRMRSQPKPEPGPKTLDEYAIRQAEGGDRSILDRLLNAKTDKGQGGAKSGEGDNKVFGMTPDQWTDVGGDWANRQYNRLGRELGAPQNDKGAYSVPPYPTVGPSFPSYEAKIDSMNAFGNMTNWEAGQRYLDQLQGKNQAPQFTNNLSVLSRPQQAPAQAPPPPPNDGSFSDDEYEEFVRQWANNPDWWGQ